MQGKTMKAARLHESGKPLQLEHVPAPSIKPTEVLVKVEACGIVQNLQNVLANWHEMAPDLPLPELPAIFGLDPAGIVESVGDQVYSYAPGDRVYVNPGRGCGSCRACQAGRETACDSFTLVGYFGMGPGSKNVFKDYPYGGLCEYVTAPQSSLVKLAGNVSFEIATRLGYLGTAYQALLRAEAGPGKVVFINGISGTLGLGAVALALAMGAKQVLGTARDEDLFPRVKALAAPGRVDILKSGSEPVKEWSKKATAGHGIDIVIDAMGPGSPKEPFLEALQSLNRGGFFVDIGAMTEQVPINMFWVMSNNITLIGSTWFTTPVAQKMVDMVETGQLDLGFYEHKIFSLEAVNDAVSDTESRKGGFTNYVVKPDQ